MLSACAAWEAAGRVVGGDGGGWRLSGGGGGSGSQAAVSQPKSDLPAELTVADLDTSHFDSMAYELGLSDKQQKKIGELKTQDQGNLR